MEDVALTKQALVESLERWARYSQHYSPDVRAYRNRAQIQLLTDEQCQMALDRINAYLKVFDSVDPEVLRKQDEESLLKAAIKHLNLHCLDDQLFKKINEGDIVEIYDANFVQLYRNLVFMKYCSYDLFSLVTLPHAELYSVPAEEYKMLYDALFSAFHTSIKTVDLTVKPYRLKEKYGERNRIFQINLKICCPLFDEQGKRVAFVVTNKCNEHHVSLVN